MNRVRPEIQALRAVAVAVVVVCHFWPDALPGGFIGVDVFFVISGFLITSHLLREVDRTGTVSLPAFWARRARRILPAALLVLAFCAAGTAIYVPDVNWQQFFAEIRASAAYVQNWQLAHSAVDYFARGESPSPVQHFWSLSAEEQFYLVWPVLILIGATIHRHAIAVALAGVTAASFAYSILKTGADPAAAYFITPTRAWEFGAGGLLALFSPATATPALRSAVSWAGLALIAYASIAFSAATEFPGYAALAPVLGSIAVIWAGVPERRWAPTRAYELRPVQYVGDVSYGIYLWHWPLLVLAPYAFAGGVPRGSLLAVTLVLSALTKRFVEDPVRGGPFLRRRRSGWTFAAAAVATGLVVAASAEGSAQFDRVVQKAELQTRAILASNPRCFGAAAHDPAKPCSNPALRLKVVPSPAEAHLRRNFPCNLVETRGYLYVCSFGVKPEAVQATVALVGDSHAAHWRAALDGVAKRRHWFGYSLSHTGCPLSTTVHNSLKGVERAQCLGWNRQVLAWLKRHPEISTLIVSAIAGGERDHQTDAAGGYLAAWNRLPPSIRQIVVIRDTPRVRGATDDCVTRAISANRQAGPACRIPRGEAMAPDPEVAAARRLRSRPVQVVDMTRYICDPGWCEPVIGGVLVYKDQNHLTETYGKTLSPYLGRAIGAGSGSS
jgi:peptidoglycan/LPS O-acetylase OafA/YrhL